MGNNTTIRPKRRLPTFRRSISLTLVLSGIIVIISSVVLYIGPPTHIAFFTDWVFFGLTKFQWNAIHLVNGIVFTLGIIFHSYYNWKSIVSYLKNHHRKLVIFSGDFIIATVITIAICICSILFLPSAKQIMHLGHLINQKHIRNYGVFPYGNEERYLFWKTALYLGLDEKVLIHSLRGKNITVESRTQSIADIAFKNKISSAEVLEVMQNSALLWHLDKSHKRIKNETGNNLCKRKKESKDY